MGARLMAIVAEGDRGRVYLAPTPEHEVVARESMPEWRPEGDVPARLTGGTCVPYGLTTWGDLFTPRQLVALTIFSDLVAEVIDVVERDAANADCPNDGRPLRNGDAGVTTYAEAVGVYMALLINQIANHSSSMCGWNNVNTQMRSVFARQAIPMVWDYAESNLFCESSGSYANLFERLLKSFETLGNGLSGATYQADVNQQFISSDKLVSTDPPYYDNIGYADLSDFFLRYGYVVRSLRPTLSRSLRHYLPCPKAAELVATPYRHGSKRKGRSLFFLPG